MSPIDSEGRIYLPTLDSEKPRFGATFHGVTEILVVLILCGAGLFGFKIYRENSRAAEAAADRSEIERLTQQLSDTQKRLEQYEKRGGRASSAASSENRNAASTSTKPTAPAPETRGYEISSASALSAIAPAPQSLPTFAHPRTAASAPATPRDTRSVSFTLDDVGILSSVGQYTLQLKTIDPANHRYSLCIYVRGRCIDLDNHAVNEVVEFSVEDSDVPLKLVATRLTRTQVSGYVVLPGNTASAAAAQK